MATAEGQAFMDQTQASLLVINNELGILRNDQDSTANTVLTITADVGAFKAKQRVATTAHAERVQRELQLHRNEIAALQVQLASLDINQLLLTQGLMTDEKIRSAMIGMGGIEKKTESTHWQKPIPESKANMI